VNWNVYNAYLQWYAIGRLAGPNGGPQHASVLDLHGERALAAALGMDDAYNDRPPCAWAGVKKRVAEASDDGKPANPTA
jgi:hypothetical protein